MNRKLSPRPHLKLCLFTLFNFVMAGMDDPNRSSMTIENALQDDKRIRFHRDYLSNLSAAIRY